jgi:O-methyltransferase
MGCLAARPSGYKRAMQADQPHRREFIHVSRSVLVRLGNLGYRGVWFLWTRKGLRRIRDAVIERLPAKARPWVENRKRDVLRFREWQPGLAQRLLEGREAPLVPERELEEQYRDVLNRLALAAGRDEVGDYLEFGVYVGSSLLCMHRASRGVGLESLRLYGFDSFQGFPKVAATESAGVLQPGWLRAEYSLVREHLTRNGIDWDRTTLVPGWFEETLVPGLADQLGIKKAGIIMIDCVLYSAAHTALTFCAPLIRDRAVVFVDGWYPRHGDSRWSGESRAFEELLAGNPDLRAEELPLPYNQTSKVFLLTRGEADTRDRRATRATQHPPA